MSVLLYLDESTISKRHNGFLVARGVGKTKGKDGAAGRSDGKTRKYWPVPPGGAHRDCPDVRTLLT
jgi:hypothetical protein